MKKMGIFVIPLIFGLLILSLSGCKDKTPSSEGLPLYSDQHVDKVVQKSFKGAECLKIEDTSQYGTKEKEYTYCTKNGVSFCVKSFVTSDGPTPTYSWRDIDIDYEAGFFDYYKDEFRKILDQYNVKWDKMTYREAPFFAFQISDIEQCSSVAKAMGEIAELTEKDVPASPKDKVALYAEFGKKRSLLEIPLNRHDPVYAIQEELERYYLDQAVASEGYTAWEKVIAKYPPKKISTFTLDGKKLDYNSAYKLSSQEKGRDLEKVDTSDVEIYYCAYYSLTRKQYEIEVDFSHYMGQDDSRSDYPKGICTSLYDYLRQNYYPDSSYTVNFRNKKATCILNGHKYEIYYPYVFEKGVLTDKPTFYKDGKNMHISIYGFGKKLKPSYYNYAAYTIAVEDMAKLLDLDYKVDEKNAVIQFTKKG